MQKPWRPVDQPAPGVWFDNPSAPPAPPVVLPPDMVLGDDVEIDTEALLDRMDAILVGLFLVLLVGAVVFFSIFAQPHPAVSG